MAKQRDSSVADFPQEFFQIWNLAKDERLSLEFETKGKATNFKQRLYRFRKALARENPGSAQEFMSVDIEAVELNGKGLLRQYMPEWRRQLKTAAPGAVPHRVASVTEHEKRIADWASPEGFVPPIPPPEPDVGTPLADTLHTLGFGTEEPQRGEDKK